MTSVRTYWLLLVGFFILSVGLAEGLVPRYLAVEHATRQSDNFFKLLLGDSSQMFANNFFMKADAYYHSGYYPTIFDNRQAFETAHMAADTGAVASHNTGEETSFMGPPRDWIDAFGRNFIPNRHTHLDEGGPTDDLSNSSKVREILPWLDLSAKLDPSNIKTYLVMAYWLRNKLNKAPEAEQVLREGLRANPGDPQLLFELGRIYYENYDEPGQARGIWNAAIGGWMKEEPGVPLAERLQPSDQNFDNRFIFEQIETSLGLMEKNETNYDAAIAHLQQAQLASTTSGDIQQEIDAIKQLKQKQPGH
jgi:tetratricopeptide (TPR) repeat protein